MNFTVPFGYLLLERSAGDSIEYYAVHAAFPNHVVASGVTPTEVLLAIDSLVSQQELSAEDGKPGNATAIIEPKILPSNATGDAPVPIGLVSDAAEELDATWRHWSSRTRQFEPFAPSPHAALRDISFWSGMVPLMFFHVNKEGVVIGLDRHIEDALVRALSEEQMKLSLDEEDMLERHRTEGIQVTSLTRQEHTTLIHRYSRWDVTEIRAGAQPDASQSQTSPQAPRVLGA